MRRSGSALPDADLLVAVGPEGGPRGLHGFPGPLGQRSPVLQVTGEGGGGHEAGRGGGWGAGKGLCHGRVFLSWGVRRWPEWRQRAGQVTVLARGTTPEPPAGLRPGLARGTTPRNPPLACGQCWPGGRPPGTPRWPAAPCLRHGALALSLPGAWPGAISGNGRATGSAASLLLPCSSNRSRPRLVVSTTSLLPVRAMSAAARATAGPHIIPAPPAQATVTPVTGPSGPSAGPMIGRWSGV